MSKNIFNWLKSRFSNRGKALSLYRQAMARAEKHDHQGAIGDYTTVIDMPDAPSDVRAMALYNRALVHHTAKDDSKAIDDLNRVLEMDQAQTEVKTKARQKLLRMERRSNRNSV